MTDYKRRTVVWQRFAFAWRPQKKTVGCVRFPASRNGGHHENHHPASVCRHVRRHPGRTGGLTSTIVGLLVVRDTLYALPKSEVPGTYRGYGQSNFGLELKYEFLHGLAGDLVVLYVLVFWKLQVAGENGRRRWVAHVLKTRKPPLKVGVIMSTRVMEHAS